MHTPDRSRPGIGTLPRVYDEESLNLSLELIVGFATLGRQMNEALAGISGSELLDNRAITLLSNLELEGPMRPGEVAQMVELTTGGVTKLVSRLESAGLVKRSHGDYADDLRAVKITITEQGSDLIRRYAYELVLRISEARLTIERMHLLAQDF